MAADDLDESIPRLALVWGGLASDHSPMRLAEAAEGVCRLLWVLPPQDGLVPRATSRFLRGLGDVVDATEMSSEDAAETIRAIAPAGITCFIDRHLVWTAEVAEILGLPFHSRRTALDLTDKLEQREALQSHGLPTPPFWDADELTRESTLQSAIRAGFPLVMKPRRGTSSQDATAVTSEVDLRAALSMATPGRMLIEGFIPDPSVPCTGAGSAPYVSVEVLVSNGTVSVLGITGRAPLAPPFRETGFYFPADVSPEVETELKEMAIVSTRALGVDTGALHVEIKCTDAGPVTIEVNGRPGGHAVSPLLKRALNIDTIRMAMRVAVREHVVLDDTPTPSEVVFRFDVQPDAKIKHITAVDGIDEVQEIPGVEQVVRGAGAGDDYSWRSGTLGYVAAVLGAAPDHNAVNRIRDEVLDRIIIEGTA